MTNEKQQTALEWYIQQHKILAKLSDTLSNGEILNRISDIENEAKKMEKEQIIKAIDSNFIYHENRISTIGEQYYNETYGGNK